MPSLDTFLSWGNDPSHPEFPAMYARARASRVDVLADDMLAISDDAAQDKRAWRKKAWKDADGSLSEVGTTDGDAVQRARLRIDTRKWLLSKLAPKRFGNQAEVQVTDDRPRGALIVPGVYDLTSWEAAAKKAAAQQETMRAAVLGDLAVKPPG